MANIITRRSRLSRRFFLKGLTATQAPVILGLPPLVSMFNSTGTAYAAPATTKTAPVEKRFVIWFNGNGIPERYWIPDETGPDYALTPCLNPLARLRDHVHIVSGLDNSAIVNTAFDGHSTAMSGLMTCTRFSGRGPSGPSIDQVVARRIGSETRFRSLQVGVSQECFGGAMQKNMSWTGRCRRRRSRIVSSIEFSAQGMKAGSGASEAYWTPYGSRPRRCSRICRKRTRLAWTSISLQCAISSA